MSLNGTVWAPIGPSPISQGGSQVNGLFRLSLLVLLTRISSIWVRPVVAFGAATTAGLHRSRYSTGSCRLVLGSPAHWRSIRIIRISSMSEPVRVWRLIRRRVCSSRRMAARAGYGSGRVIRGVTSETLLSSSTSGSTSLSSTHLMATYFTWRLREDAFDPLTVDSTGRRAPIAVGMFAHSCLTPQRQPLRESCTLALTDVVFSGLTMGGRTGRKS